jgi:hypothetical protein
MTVTLTLLVVRNQRMQKQRNIQWQKMSVEFPKYPTLHPCKPHHATDQTLVFHLTALSTA